jgi:hypothetical protein
MGRETMARVYRISEGPDVNDILGSIESSEAFAGDHGQGSYDIDEQFLDTFHRPQDLV